MAAGSYDISKKWQYGYWCVVAPWLGKEAAKTGHLSHGVFFEVSCCCSPWYVVWEVEVPYGGI